MRSRGQCCPCREDEWRGIAVELAVAALGVHCLTSPSIGIDRSRSLVLDLDRDKPAPSLMAKSNAGFGSFCTQSGLRPIKNPVKHNIVVTPDSERLPIQHYRLHLAARISVVKSLKSKSLTDCNRDIVRQTFRYDWRHYVSRQTIGCFSNHGV